MPREAVQRSKVIVNLPAYESEDGLIGEGPSQVELGDQSWPSDFVEGATLTGGPQVDVSWQRGEGQHDGWVQVSIENKEKQVSLVSDTFTRRELLNFIRVLRRACAAAFDADE